MATGKAVEWMSTKINFDIFGSEISNEVKRVAEAVQWKNGNFEDQIRVANELLRGLEILQHKKVEGDSDNEHANTLRCNLVGALRSFTISILEGECELASFPLINTEKFSIIS